MKLVDSAHLIAVVFEGRRSRRTMRASPYPRVPCVPLVAMFDSMIVSRFLSATRQARTDREAGRAFRKRNGRLQTPFSPFSGLVSGADRP